MNRPVLSRLCIVMALLAAGLAARSSPLYPVRDPHASHLGIVVEAPGTDGWLVAEDREKTRWKIMYQHADPNDTSRTSAVFLKTERFKPGKFARTLGSLEQLAQDSFKAGRTGEDPRFTERLAELDRDTIQGQDAWRMRLAFEERDNPAFPGAVLLLEVVEVYLMHPHNPEQLISVTSSTRYKVGQGQLSAGALLTPFMAAIRFE